MWDNYLMEHNPDADLLIGVVTAKPLSHWINDNFPIITDQ